MIEILSVKIARHAESIGKTVLLRGWVRTRRDSKAGFSFIELNDGSCFGNVQVLAPNSLANYDSVVLKLTGGCSVAVSGIVKESPGQGQATEVEATAVELLGAADAQSCGSHGSLAYPLQKKRHSLEFLRTIAHLRPRTNTFGAVARVRNQVCASIHNFFQEEGFLYVNTPIITASDCEGAGEMFRVTTLDFDNPPRTQNGKIDDAKDFFERRAYLTVSGQLEGETYACGLGRIYTFGPTFRAENSNTARHLAEFWMVEPEAAFYELPDNMDLAERFLKRIFRDVMERCDDDMQFFNSHIDTTILKMLTGICDSSFEHLPYTQAIDILLKSGEQFEYPVRWGMDLQSEHERFIVERHFNKPVILFDYPRAIKPFYMKVNDDEKTVRAMDVLVPKVGEIIGGSQREERLDVLLHRMKEQDINIDDYWWYVDLRRYGTVPHAGFGLGVERAVQFVTGMANIRDVIPFPRTPGSCEF